MKIKLSISIILILLCSLIGKAQQITPDTAMQLIPAGEFIMGSNGQGDFSPAHTVYVDSFYIDKYEVTNAEYFRFCQSTSHQLPEFWGMDKFKSGPEFPDYPVTGINWYDAVKYAEWEGKRLPTEAEWEYAARGGLKNKMFPNGDRIDTTLANITFRGLRTAPVQVGCYSPNGYGIYDMAGNVTEWVMDWYESDYYSKAGRQNPQGPVMGKFKVIRGGGWHSGPSCIKVYYRNALPSNWVDFNVGFRCVKDVKN
jgi:formylglycine-generating enzyme